MARTGAEPPPLAAPAFADSDRRVLEAGGPVLFEDVAPDPGGGAPGRGAAARDRALPQHLARRATVGAMVSGIAHELNQPLAAASNCLGGATRLLEVGAPEAARAAAVRLGLAARLGGG